MKRDFSTVLRNLRGEIIRVEDPTRPTPEGEEAPPATLAFVATEALMQHVLWPHLSIERRAEMMEGILSTFDR